MTVVLGYDESPGAEEALRVAIDVAKRFGEPLRLVYGAAPPGGLGEEFKAHRAALLVWLLVLSVRDMSDPANSYSGQSWLGVGPPLVIGIGIFLAGLALMLFWRTRDARFWQERAGVADPDVVRGRKVAHSDPDGLEG